MLALDSVASSVFALSFVFLVYGIKYVRRPKPGYVFHGSFSGFIRMFEENRSLITYCSVKQKYEMVDYSYLDKY